ncbi:MAG: AI-2E family transporter [Thermoleophilia bacterium]|nr:AI-2E family transporter [Thermoleophilia bacterium]
MPPERVVSFRPRAVLGVVAVVLAVAAALQLVWLARQVITWILVAFFLALALNPLVEWIQRLGVRRRGLATAVAFLAALAVIAVLGLTFVPILVREIRDFADAVPGYVADLTAGRGRLGFLERDYQVVDRVRDAIGDAGAGRLLGFSGTALAVTKGVVTAIVATITIAVMTFFMLLEGPAWIDRGLALLRPESAERWRRVGHQLYRTVGGFVTGAVTIALVAGITTAILLSALGVPYAIALGLVVALLDLVPLAGAVLATILVTTVGLLDSVTVGLVILAFFLVYQQVENHFLYPLVYSRTVQLSPLAILIAVLIGASLAGILGALAAIPVAGAAQVLLREWLGQRHRPVVPPAGAGASPNAPSPG